MDTSSLKDFAKRARTRLLRDVNVRIDRALAKGSHHRLVAPDQVAGLERAIDTHGRKVTVERHAYRWFNRLVALQFMDVNGYNSWRVVAAPAGVAATQPEVLTAAKRGEFDTDVVSSEVSSRVLGLINARISSPNPEEEAYRILLTSYCDYWNEWLPFLFDGEGGYSELLIPDDLLTDGSILVDLQQTLTQEACQSVEVIGWLYQFYISDRKAEVVDAFKKKLKAGSEEIPPATQLFTPHWIVRYLVENSLGRLWMLNHPESSLIEQMDYYVPPVGEQKVVYTVSSPEDIKVVDPACGSGHMLTYAFDLLFSIYEEEGYERSVIPALILEKNLYGIELDERAANLAAFALTMKARKKNRTFFRKLVQPNVVALQNFTFTDDEIKRLYTPDGNHKEEGEFWRLFEHADTIGSLAQPNPESFDRIRQHVTSLQESGAPVDLASMATNNLLQKADAYLTQVEYLLPRYTVTVANPPYMGTRKFGTVLKSFFSKNYEDSKRDLYSAFIERCLVFTRIGGYTAMVTMQSWMFLSSFEKLRNNIMNSSSLEVAAHLGTRGFDSIDGEVVATVAFVLTAGGKPGISVFIRLVEGQNGKEKSQLLRQNLAEGQLHYRKSQRVFDSIPGSVLSYWLSDEMTNILTDNPALAAVVQPRQGLATADNSRFLRYWWEVSQDRASLNSASREEAEETGARWFPHLKGGEFRKWYGNLQYLVNWEHDGHEIRQFRDDKGKQRSRPQAMDTFFKPGITWTLMSGTAGFRWADEGAISGTKGPVIVTDNSSILGILNSTSFSRLLESNSQGLAFEVGSVAQTPLPRDMVAGDVDKLVELSRQDWDEQETSWDFQRNPLLNFEGTLTQRWEGYYQQSREIAAQMKQLEEENNQVVARAYGLESEVETDVSDQRVSLLKNPVFRYEAGLSEQEYESKARADAARDLVSYAVGCIFGRYSLEKPGLILGDSGQDVADFHETVGETTFEPDADNVIPIVDGDWFEDDIAERLRKFLSAAFGVEHLSENLHFLEEALGVKNIRDYFIKGRAKKNSPFFRDHVNRYHKRPIYWMFSSPKRTFNALFYLHRYNQDTPGLVLNEYLREYIAKLEAELPRMENNGAKPKEIEALRRALVEIKEYERDQVYPLAVTPPEVDLDDGVEANYAKFGSALREIR